MIKHLNYLIANGEVSNEQILSIKITKRKGDFKMQGTVKFYDKTKGWGFITLDNKDYFVHYSNLQMKGHKELNQQDIVWFEVSDPDDRGRIQAVNVKPILTLAMVLKELKKEGLHIMRIGDNKGIHSWYVVDKSNKLVVDKEMNLSELAAFSGYDVEELPA